MSGRIEMQISKENKKILYYSGIYLMILGVIGVAIKGTITDTILSMILVVNCIGVGELMEMNKQMS